MRGKARAALVAGPPGATSSHPLTQPTPLSGSSLVQLVRVCQCLVQLEVSDRLVQGKIVLGKMVVQGKMVLLGLVLVLLAGVSGNDLNRQSIIFNENTPDVFYCPQVWRGGSQSQSSRLLTNHEFCSSISCLWGCGYGRVFSEDVSKKEKCHTSATLKTESYTTSMNTQFRVAWKTNKIRI